MAKKYPAWVKRKSQKLMYDELSTSGKRQLSAYVRKAKMKKYLQLKKELGK